MHKPTNARIHGTPQQQLRGRHGTDISLGSLRERRALEHLDVGLLASRTEQEDISLFYHPVCSTLLRQSQEVNVELTC